MKVQSVRPKYAFFLSVFLRNRAPPGRVSPLGSVDAVFWIIIGHTGQV